MDFETIAREIVDSAIRVHTRIGAGMLESAYEACMEYEIGKRSLAVLALSWRPWGLVLTIVPFDNHIAGLPTPMRRWGYSESANFRVTRTEAGDEL